MDDRTHIDELRALLAGTLPSEEAERLRRRCAADPALRAVLDRMAEAHALTEPAAEAPPPCRLTIEEVESALVPQRAWRKVLRWPSRVSAAVLVLVGGAFVLGRVLSHREAGPVFDPGPADRTFGGEAGRPLVLAAIPSGREETPSPESEIPAVLADYRPVEDGEIQWVTSLDEAKAMARLCSRPVLLFLHYPTCPWCVEMREGILADPQVLARVGSFVPALVNIQEADPAFRALARSGWPWLGVLDASGEVVLAFPGLRRREDKKKHDDLVRQLARAAGLAGPPPADWLIVNTAARQLLEARSAEEAGDLASAYGAYYSLAARVGASGLSARAVQGIRRIGELARQALEGARSLSEGGVEPGAVLDALEAEVRRFEGTPYAADLSMVRDHLRDHGTFPRTASLR